MWPNPQFPADLVTFTEEIFHGKLSFLCSVSASIYFGNPERCQQIIMAVIPDYLRKIFYWNDFDYTLLTWKTSCFQLTILIQSEIQRPSKNSKRVLCTERIKKWCNEIKASSFINFIVIIPSNYIIWHIWTTFLGIPEFPDSGRKSWTLDSGRWTLDAGL